MPPKRTIGSVDENEPPHPPGPAIETPNKRECLMTAPSPLSQPCSEPATSSTSVRDPQAGYHAALEAIETAIIVKGKVFLSKLIQAIPGRAADLVKYIDLLESRTKHYMGFVPKELTRDAIMEEAAYMQRVIVKGLQDAMVWKPQCKSGEAICKFIGLCKDPAYMSEFLGMDSRQLGPAYANTTFLKGKKFTKDEFTVLLGVVEIRKPSRYGELVLTNDVTLRYNIKSGQYEIISHYGQRAKPNSPQRASPGAKRRFLCGFRPCADPEAASSSLMEACAQDASQAMATPDQATTGSLESEPTMASPDQTTTGTP